MNKMRLMMVLLLAVTLATAAGCGGEEGEKCTASSCGYNASCDDSSGEIVCVCDPGYQDKNGNNTCMPDCATADLDCGDNGHCQDESGDAECVCDQGYRGNDCGDCADDYQDKDQDGVCKPRCTAAGLDCHHGSCDDASGTAECVCDQGYVGADCTTCDEGYQDNNSDGTCELDCQTANPDCGDHGACDDSGGSPICACDTGYAGNRCDICAEGYQDNDSDGRCTEGCSLTALDCGDYGTCDDSNGAPICICDEGYTGEVCDSCLSNYQDNDQNGTCRPRCPSYGGCNSHGDCDDSTGEMLCDCDQGYTGDLCDSCQAGYQDNDENGSCRPDCPTADLGCKHGECSDLSGTARCECEETWAGPICDQCAPGYQDNDEDDDCEPNCVEASLGCPDHAHCDDTSGTAVCICDSGYLGVDCTDCDEPNYQDNDLNGTCYPSCAFLGWSCSGLGNCEDALGVASCLCDEGYQHDGNGNCIEPTGFTCATALLLDIAADSITGSTDGTGDDYNGSCSSEWYTTEEMVYLFNVNEPVHAKFYMSSSYPAMYLRSACEDADSEIMCDNNYSESQIEVDLTEGTYYLFVETSGGSGNYTLTIDITCPEGFIFDPSLGICVDNPCMPNECVEPNKNICEPVLPDSYVCHCNPGYIDDGTGTCIVDPNPHGESCADPIPLTAGEGTVSGSTWDALDDGGCSCSNGGEGPDRVYYFELLESYRAEFVTSGFDTILHLRTQCDSQSSEIACDDDDGPGYGSQIIEIMDPGTYFLFVDSYQDEGGDYDLDYSFRQDPCVGDPCPGIPECVASSDWSSYQCICPEGYIPWDDDCVDDPCDPNECSEPNKNRCVVDEFEPIAVCECNIGYIEDAQGNCYEDPNANEWAWIVFLNADNNLDSMGVEDVWEMAQAGSTPYVHIVALYDRYTDVARKIYVCNSNNSNTPDCPEAGYEVTEEVGEINMSDWQTMRDFGIWAVENYPARHYAFIAWDHGGGWHKNGEPKHPLFKGFSNDENPGPNGGPDEISIADGSYANALSGITAALGDKLDIVGHDECLMGMWEVAEATAPYAHYLLASEETEPGRGWPYHGFLPALIEDWTKTPLELASSVCDAYYDEASDDSTLSVIDLGTMDDLADAMTVFADALMANSALYSSISTVRNATQSFYYSDNLDLMDFALGIAAMADAPTDLVDAANALVAQLEISIAYNRAQSDYSGAYGMAVYLPPLGYGMDTGYTDSGAVWSQRTTWDEFLADFCN